jgi:hypothetical protein
VGELTVIGLQDVPQSCVNIGDLSRSFADKSPMPARSRWGTSSRGVRCKHYRQPAAICDTGFTPAPLRQHPRSANGLESGQLPRGDYRRKALARQSKRSRAIAHAPRLISYCLGTARTRLRSNWFLRRFHFSGNRVISNDAGRCKSFFSVELLQSNASRRRRTNASVLELLFICVTLTCSAVAFINSVLPTSHLFDHSRP